MDKSIETLQITGQEIRDLDFLWPLLCHFQIKLWRYNHIFRKERKGWENWGNDKSKNRTLQVLNHYFNSLSILYYSSIARVNFFLFLFISLIREGPLNMSRSSLTTNHKSLWFLQMKGNHVYVSQTSGFNWRFRKISFKTQAFLSLSMCLCLL